jgi:hypothetical protein
MVVYQNADTACIRATEFNRYAGNGRIVGPIILIITDIVVAPSARYNYLPLNQQLACTSGLAADYWF